MHKVIESYPVVFVEYKDEMEMPFRLGITQGLDDETIQSGSQTSPNPNFSLSPTVPLQSVPAPATTTIIPATETTPAPPTHATATESQTTQPQRSTRIPIATTRAAGPAGSSRICYDTRKIYI